MEELCPRIGGKVMSKRLDKEKVKELYLKGHNAPYIAEVLKSNVDAVRQCICRNCKEFKKSHLAIKLRNKEVDRITRFESKQYMSDSVFIKKNMSIYKTNKNGDLVLNKDVAPIVSYDTPEILKNEDGAIAIDKRIKKSKYRNDNLLFSGEIT